VAALCRECGVRMDILVEGQEYHMTCGPRRMEDAVKARLMEVIKWADANSDRTLQVGLGPSELGENCERQLAYRIAGVQGVNKYMDPWKAIVGTAIHSWLEDAVNSYQRAHGLHEFMTETVIPIDEMVTGHSDLFWRNSVWDYKSKGKDKLKQLKLHGPTDKEIDQIQLYGLGQERAGRKVEYVGIIGLPRDGWLEDIVVWADKYDRRYAESVLQRPYLIALNLLEQQPIDWESVPAAPSRLCGFCPFYRGGRPADSTGCPGDSQSRLDKAAEGLIIPKEEV
jgi:hypothetical protein